MLELLRLVAAVGIAASWIVCFIAAIVGMFTVYIGVAMWATLRADDADKRKIRYRMFRDLLGAIFPRRRR
jgi:hypothetical protein